MSLILSLLLFGESLAEHKRALLEAIANTNDVKGAEAVEKIVSFDSKEGVEALVSALGTIGRVSSPYEQERERWYRVMEANAYDPETKKWKGSIEKYKDARAKHTEVSGKLARLGTVSFAIGRGLGKMRSDAAVQEMLARLRPEGVAAVRAAIAGALAYATQPEVGAAVASQFRKEKDPGVRVALTEALRAHKNVDVLCEALKDVHWPVRVAAAQGLGALRSREAIEPLIAAMGESDGRVRAEMNTALVAITGVNKHADPAAWKSWWERNRESFLAGTYKPEPAERGREAGGTTFYGLPVTSKKVVFVLDRSGSMAAAAKWKPEDVASGDAPNVSKPKGERKIDIAKYELKKVLALLPEGAEFNIVFYNSIQEPFSEKMVVLNRETRRRAIAFVDGIEPSGATNISDALARGMGFAGAVEKASKAGVDTIYLLSDGMPTAGIVDVDEFCGHVAGANRLKKVSIHTVAIEPTADSEKFMKRLAKENGGAYAKR